MLQEIRRKVEAGERLSAADGEFLFSPEVDLHAVGELADVVRRRKNGDAAYYNLNLHLNPTNVCIYRCALCAYSRDEDDPRAYTMSQAEILARAKEAADAGCTELHIVGGVHPQKTVRLVSGHDPRPARGLSPSAPEGVDRRGDRPLRPDRQAAGAVDSGGFDGRRLGQHARRRGRNLRPPGPHAKSVPARPTPAPGWTSIARPTNWGCAPTPRCSTATSRRIEHRIEHLVRLRDLQDATGGFQAFVPLKFHPENTALSYLRQVSALEDLRVVAVSRLMLDNFDHIKAYWISLGVGTAQTALAYGADDLDGTVRHERIHHDAGATSPEALTIEQLRA